MSSSLRSSRPSPSRPPGPADSPSHPLAGPDERADPVRGGFGMYRSVLGQIVAADHPILVVVDDLQWADPDSLRLVEHIAADLATTRVLLVATTRPLDDQAPDAIVDCLAEIARIPTSRQLEIGGLRVDDVADWLDGRDDVDVPDGVAALVHERTGGNPLFVKELTELLAAEGRLDDIAAVADTRAIPPGVRFVVRRRVSRLPRATQQLLSTAAVLGSPFRIDTLAATADNDGSQVLADLGPALDEGLLVEVRGDLAFSHALVADALASEINPARSASIHARGRPCPRGDVRTRLRHRRRRRGPPRTRRDPRGNRRARGRGITTGGRGGQQPARPRGRRRPLGRRGARGWPGLGPATQPPGSMR